MASTTALRLRRNAAQKHALAMVEREIRASDPNCRSKYLREFREAFSSYHSVLGEAQLGQALRSSDIVLVGDYHALPACQQYCSRLLGELHAASERPLVLGVEALFARDQHVLDEWQRGEIDEQELRQRTRYDLDWQYEWQPFYELLLAARACGANIYALDCLPRGNIRRIAVRDRHAAQVLAGIRGRHPEAQIVVLFGESHLAPSHLPAELSTALPGDRRLTILQNLDPLWWQAAGERSSHVSAVRVSDDVVCVFNATPLEKYESYRLYLDRWRRARRSTVDFAPAFYNLIEALLRFLGIDEYAGRPSWPPLVDRFPEVHSCVGPGLLRKLLLKKKATLAEMLWAQDEMRRHGACYLPRLNVIVAAKLDMAHAAELAAEFLIEACCGDVSGKCEPESAPERFYRSVLRRALVDFAARVLYPARPLRREEYYYSLYGQSREQVERRSLHSYREYLEMLDFLLLHKDYEALHRHYVRPPELIERGLQAHGARFEFLTRELGSLLGSELYEAYIAGRLHRRSLRSWFLRCSKTAGKAATLYFAVARRMGRPRRRLVA